jgi:hypothetical protein
MIVTVIASPRLCTFLLGAYPADNVVSYVATRPQLASGQHDVEHDHRLHVQTGEVLPGLRGEIDASLLIPFPVAIGRIQDLGDVPLDV